MAWLYDSLFVNRLKQNDKLLNFGSKKPNCQCSAHDQELLNPSWTRMLSLKTINHIVKWGSQKSHIGKSRLDIKILFFFRSKTIYLPIKFFPRYFQKSLCVVLWHYIDYVHFETDRKLSHFHRYTSTCNLLIKDPRRKEWDI